MEQKLTYQFGEEARNRWLAARRPTSTVKPQPHPTAHPTASDRRKHYKRLDGPALTPR